MSNSFLWRHDQVLSDGRLVRSFACFLLLIFFSFTFASLKWKNRLTSL